jgi:fatty acid-binding protein DegV
MFVCDFQPISSPNIPSAPMPPAREDSHYSNDNDADSWDDDWDDDYDQQSTVSGSQPNINGEARRRVTSMSRNATIKKSLNRLE